MSVAGEIGVNRLEAKVCTFQTLIYIYIYMQILRSDEGYADK